ncbi:MAG: hypothetical protein HPY45_16935 [Anaerolineae bacterium]|nr:hypothetical protein [Anaerolineae bacterium]
MRALSPGYGIQQGFDHFICIDIPLPFQVIVVCYGVFFVLCLVTRAQICQGAFLLVFKLLQHSLVMCQAAKQNDARILARGFQWMLYPNDARALSAI